MKKLTLLLLLTGCVNPWCQQLANKQVDIVNSGYNQCIKEAYARRNDPTHNISNQEVDDCMYKSYLFTKKMCGV